MRAHVCVCWLAVRWNTFELFVQIGVLWLKNQQLHATTCTIDVYDSKVGILFLVRTGNEPHIKARLGGGLDDDTAAA